MKRLISLGSALVLSAFANTALAADRPIESEILERSAIVTALLVAAANGKAAEFKRLSAPGAVGKVDFNDVPFIPASFAKFGQSCKYDHVATLAYGSKAHFQFDCGSLSPFSKTWFANAVVKDRKITFLSLFWAPPSSPAGVKKVG